MRNSWLSNYPHHLNDSQYILTIALFCNDSFLIVTEFGGKGAFTILVV